MRVAPSPRLHLFVCANRREDSPLGPGCGERGDALYAALKSEVAARRKYADIWITRTHCLGVCPKRGATVARYPGARCIVADVEVDDVDVLLAELGSAQGIESVAWQELQAELDDLLQVQEQKVLELARRRRPGVAPDDLQSAEDLPELEDPDGRHAEGVLAGMRSASAALRALQQRLLARRDLP
jgi:(2Fe-2S) ferredoxin